MSNYDEEREEVMGLLGLGDDDEDDDMMGARGSRGRLRRMLGKNIAPGVPKAGVRFQPLGMGTASFVNAGPVTINLTVAPQRLYQPRKLVVAIARNGATAVGLVSLNNLNIGSTSQMAAQNPIPAALFDPATQGNPINWDQASPGVNISMDVILGAPALAVGATVDVSVGFLGETIG